MSEISEREQLEFQAHLQEYDLLYREHDLHHKMRQEIITQALVATLALVGAIMGQSLGLSGSPLLLKFFLVIPIFFTLITWWYIRTNQANVMIDLYIIKELEPRMSQLANAQVSKWPKFEWAMEFSPAGRIIGYFQTLARLGIVQGPAILSIIVFGYGTNWNWMSWELLDWLLLIANGCGLIVTLILLVVTQSFMSEIRKTLGADIFPPKRSNLRKRDSQKKR